MSRVLFITHNGISHEPLGLMYLSGALLRAGHETKAIMAHKALETVGSWGPDFVAFQVLTGDQDKWGRVAHDIKQHYPHVKTIFGGPHYLFFQKANQPEADFVVKGEGENAIISIVEGREIPCLNSIENLDSLAHPDRSLLYNDEFPAIRDNVIRNVITTRGCPYKCTYCYNSMKEWQELMGPKRLKSHSPEWVIEDIELAILKHGGELISFQDDIFATSMDWLERWVKLYQRLRIPFFAQLRPRFITEERIKLLKEANIHIASFAVESGVEKTRREILDREEPNDVIYKGAMLLHKHGIKFRMQNLLALPVEDPLRDALDTLKFNMKCRPTLSWCSLLQAYPGTKVADYVVKKGMVKSLEDLIPMVNATFFDECSLPIKNKKEIERLHKYWSAVVRWQWLYPIVRVLIYVKVKQKWLNWIFEKTKGYINKMEYWRVKDKGQVRAREFQSLDRLGGELVRDAGKLEVLKDCVA